MRFTRRELGGLLGKALCVAALAPALAFAQDNRPIEWVVGYPAGGGSDAVARTMGEVMSQIIKRPIAVSNKPGAGTNIAAQYVAQSRDVGSIMFTADFATLAANPWLFAKLPYDPVNDFIPVGLLARFPMFVVVGNQVPVNNLNELAAWIKSQPQGVSYGSAGLGSPHHLMGELLKDRTGWNLVHVPYRGAGPAMQDIVGGVIPLAMVDSATAKPMLDAGRVKAIAVASPQRLASFPNVPTFAEQGIAGFEAYAWQGLVVPKGTDAAFVNQLHAALQEAFKAPAVQQRFASLALEALPGTPQQMADYARAERERWGKLIREKNIRLE